jgi:hypothetical protein
MAEDRIVLGATTEHTEHTEKEGLLFRVFGVFGGFMVLWFYGFMVLWFCFCFWRKLGDRPVAF